MVFYARTVSKLPHYVKYGCIPEYLFQSDSELHHVVSKACGLLLSQPRDTEKRSQSPGLQTSNKKKGAIYNLKTIIKRQKSELLLTLRFQNHYFAPH